MTPDAFTKRLIDSRLAAVNAQKALKAKVELRDGIWSAQDERDWNRGSADIDALDERILAQIELEERNQRADIQRKPFESIVRGARMQDQSELSEFLRGAPGNVSQGVQRVALPTNSERRDFLKSGSAGAAVPLGFVGNFYLHMIAKATVRQTNAIVYTTDSGEPLVLPKSTVDPTAALVAEGVAITPNDPTLAPISLGAYGYKALVYASRELVADSTVDIEELLGRLLGRAIGTATGTAYVTGTGSAQPQGVANAPVDGVVTTWALLIAGATGPDLLQDLYHSVNPDYRPAGSWMMNDATLAALRKLKSTTNEYLIQRNLTADQPETIFGRPVFSDPNFTSGAGTGTRILFGDFSSYFAIRDVGGLDVVRSDDFRFANDEVAYRAVLRSDSKQVINDAGNSAVKALRITA